MFDIQALADNLLSPVVLCFALGVAGRLIHSDLRMPEAITKMLGIYLLFAIGLKGGISLRESSDGAFMTAILTVAAGSLIPLLVYGIARKLGRWHQGESASLAAHYGSTSAVTFLAAIAFLERQGTSVEGFMPAMLAIMELPAIAIGLMIAQRKGACSNSDSSFSGVIKHVITGQTMLLLFGGILIGMVSRPESLAAVKPLFTEPFTGILALYLLELGFIAGDSMRELKRYAAFLIPFGILFPFVAGALTGAAGLMIGLSPGGAVALSVLAGSASYIAAPAALTLACPDVKHGIPLSGSLGVTFPFNLAIGIPLHASWITYLHGLMS